MNLEQDHIKELLEKYYEGSSSLTEEETLKQFFQQQSIPSELVADRDLFLFTADKEKDLQHDGSADVLLNAFVEKQLQGPAKRRTMYVWYKISSVAAGIAILIICYLFINKQQHEAKVKDTFKDPQLAYAEVKRTLLYISQHLNKGTMPLSNVSKMNQGISQLSAFSSFGTGLKDLDLISKYYNEPKNESIKK